MKPNTLLTALVFALCAVIMSTAGAQEVLPKPEPPFKGIIGKTYKESKPDFPKPIQAPEGAPNVLIVILDDVGFGHAGTFGGAVATPTLDRLAKEGLRYNQFHTTALCSPSRGALLTGRNHHSVATAWSSKWARATAGYTGIVPNTAAGLPEILRQNGYTTARLRQMAHTRTTKSPVRPFRPAGRPGKTWGFEYFYGFMNGEITSIIRCSIAIQHRSRSPRHRKRVTTLPKTWWTTLSGG